MIEWRFLFEASHVGASGAAALARALEVNSTLTSLNLYSRVHVQICFFFIKPSFFFEQQAIVVMQVLLLLSAH